MMDWLKKKKAPQETAEPTVDLMVPRIKNLQFAEGLRQMGIPEDQMPVIKPLVGELVVTYAFDLPAMFQMVSRTDQQRMNLSDDQMFETAVQNLRREIPQIGCEQQPPLYRVLTEVENLEACVLLATSWWESQVSQLGQLYVIAPSRDFVFFTNTQDGIALLREIAADVMPQAGNHALSAQIMTWRNGAWALA